MVSAGIGTNITCDPGIEGYKPVNIVMKLSRVRMSEKDPWEKCIKISDDEGKHIGDPKEIEIAKYELHL
jgi:nicotinate phosphoribosyltransferase